MNKSRWQSLRFLLTLIFVFTVFTGMQVQPVRAEEPSGQTAAKYLVLISIDSCRPDYLTLVPTPNIDKLKSEGTFYTNSWVGQLSNDTPAGHTAISTGSFGRNNGVISFNWRDRRLIPPDWAFAITRKAMDLIKATGWTDFGLWYQQKVVRRMIEQNWVTSYENVVSGLFSSFIGESGATSIGALYKKVYPDAKVASVSGDKWYACAGMAANSADFTVFAEAAGVPPPTYNALKTLKPAGITRTEPPDYILKDAAFIRDVKDERDVDVWATDIALALIENEKPEVLLVNLPGTDDAGHATGGINAPGKMAEVIANADKQVGRIVDAYKKSGRYDKTVFVVTSDHGMTPCIGVIEQSAIDQILVEARNFSNASPHIYLQFPEQARQVAEKITDAGIPGLHGAYYRVPRADGYTYEPTAATAVKLTGEVDKCYRYLLGTYAGEGSPDIELIPAENWHINWTMFNAKPFKGNHDSATWLQQRNILLISGPGVRKGFVSDSPARLVDVAPTVLTLLGIMPEKMDGIVLADMLESSTITQRNTQSKLNNELMPLVEALKTLSKADLGAFEKK